MFFITRMLCAGQPKVPSEPGEGYSFTMTAEFSTFIGYGSGADGNDPYGSIDIEPLPANDLGTLADLTGIYNITLMSFSGDVTTLLAGLHLWVDDVDYGEPSGEPGIGISAGWYYDADGSMFGTADATAAAWGAALRPLFVDEGVYFVELK